MNILINKRSENAGSSAIVSKMKEDTCELNPCHNKPFLNPMQVGIPNAMRILAETVDAGLELLQINV